MLTGIKCKGTCRSSRYLFVFWWQPAYRFKYGSTASTMEVHKKRQGSPRSQPARRKLPEDGSTPQRSRAISCSDGKAVSCQAGLSFQTVGMCQDWLKAEACGIGLPSCFLRHTKKSLSIGNCAGCFVGPVVSSMFECEVLEHEEKFSIKWSVLKTSVYYCLFWIQYCSPKAPWASEGTVCRAKHCSIPLLADIGKIRLFLLTHKQSKSNSRVDCQCSSWD